MLKHPTSDYTSHSKMVSKRDVLVNSHTGYNFQLPDNLYINDHIESVSPLMHSNWVPPNDRELIIRAKLKTGWSSRNAPHSSTTKQTPSSTNTSDISSSSSNCSSLISDLECLEIEQVLARAAKIESKEMSRISVLYDRWNVTNKPLGNGKTNCLICNCNFGILESSPKICSDCMKNVCTTCSIETYPVASSRQNQIHLCKICSEYREFLKKSGAWFNKKVPAGQQDQQKSTQVQDVFTNCSPLRRATELHMANMRSHSPIGKDTTADNEGEDFKPISKSSTGGFKKLSDYSDEDYCAELKNYEAIDDSESDHDWPSRAQVPDVLVDKKQKQEVNGQAVDEKNAQPIQSNSSINISKNLKEELEREIYVDTIAKPSQHLSTFQTHRKPSELFEKLPTQQKDVDRSSQRLYRSTELGSSPDLKNLKEQVAASRNLSKVNHLGVNSMRAGTSMMNLSTVTGRANAEHLGSIQFTVEYIRSLMHLKIHLISCRGLASKDSNGLSDPYVKLHLLPGIAKSTKLRSKTVYKNLNPEYNQTLHYDGITLQDLETKSLRLTVNDEDTFGSDFIGEHRLRLKDLLLDEVNKFDVELDSKKDLGDEEDVSFRGKINFSIKYSRNACCLYVKINRCRQLLPMDNGKSSDPFVEIYLMPPSTKKETKSKFKTSVKKKTLDPEYAEEFKFQNIDLKSLLSKTIVLNVWDKDLGKKDYIGSVMLGQDRTGDELKHFFTMVKNTDIYHEQWHTLQDKQDTLLKTFH